MTVYLFAVMTEYVVELAYPKILGFERLQKRQVFVLMRPLLRFLFAMIRILCLSGLSLPLQTYLNQLSPDLLPNRKNTLHLVATGLSLGVR